MSSHSRESEALERELSDLVRTPIVSEVDSRVSYLVERAIGRGGFAIACLASRRSPEGSLPVVLKIMRPSVVASSGEMVARLFKKEVVALGRLNERIPPTPFVVRLYDAGMLRTMDRGRPLSVPWMAIEYVHGGVEGETLSKRVRHSLDHTGFAFDAERAGAALVQLATGLSEIHAARVIHRDFKPSNVLCCGFGATEAFKISDFGIARPTGVASTFGQLALGTPGYVAPEQIHMREEIGPWTDVFSLAGVIYYLLGGEKYFDVPSAMDGVFAATSPHRKSLRDARGLTPELAHRADACQAIDAALAKASAADPRQRFQSASELCAAIQPWLRPRAGSGRTSRRRIDSAVSAREAADRVRQPQHWRWSRLCPPEADVALVSVAWSGDGHCFAATTRGLRYWDGSRWTELRPAPVSPIQLVVHVGAGRWLFGSDGGKVYAFDAEDVAEALALPDPTSVPIALDGWQSGIVVVAALTLGGLPRLFVRALDRWLAPVELEGAASVNSLAQIDERRFLVVGRKRHGALAAIYDLGAAGLSELDAGDAYALVAAAGRPEHGVALAVGGSHVLRAHPSDTSLVRVPTSTSWSACDVDVLGGEWVAGPGHIAFAAHPNAQLDLVWQDSAWTAPFVGLLGDAGRVLAVTADGAVLEGRRTPD
jgi:serine/threonine protein kinase